MVGPGLVTSCPGLFLLCHRAPMTRAPKSKNNDTSDPQETSSGHPMGHDAVHISKHANVLKQNGTDRNSLQAQNRQTNKQKNPLPNFTSAFFLRHYHTRFPGFYLYIGHIKMKYQMELPQKSPNAVHAGDLVTCILGRVWGQ